MTQSGSNTNFGIIGNVQANAVAVGDGSCASVTETRPSSRSDFDSAIASLRSQIAALQIPNSSREVLEEDVKKLAGMSGGKAGATSGVGDVLKGLLDKLKLVGVALTTTAGFQEPIRRIAAWFHLTLP